MMLTETLQLQRRSRGGRWFQRERGERNERENNHEREAEERDMKERSEITGRGKAEKEDKNLTLALSFRAFYETTVAIKQTEW